MSEQISVAQVRQIYEAIKPVVPLMNQDESLALAVFMQKVLLRYARENDIEELDKDE